MIVMSDATYPGTEVDATASTFLDFMKDNPTPDYVKIIDMYAWAGGDGFKVLTFFDVEKGKEDEGLRYISKSEVIELRTIEGYKSEVRVVYNMVDSFEFLDMKAPEV
jgi:hypothetical protein